ncbi:unnamed protein product [Diabrotica balteata]|uniref:Uncharacterized protein n=1 Tax=Diabrotica balteata TaxID=107213 RepID=A0A9N9XL12_DIABA|nr:unnamed protein product [Diabrotica balteata]
MLLHNDNTQQGVTNYGLHCQKLDLPENEIRELIEQQTLEVTPEIGKYIKQSARGQSDNPNWFEERKSRLTSSTFGEIS